MNKKYIGAALLFVAIFAFSAQQAHASFFSNLINNIFGVKHSNLGAMASPISGDDTTYYGGSSSTTTSTTTAKTTTITTSPTSTTTASTTTVSKPTTTTSTTTAPVSSTSSTVTKSTTTVTPTPSPVTNPVTAPTTISAPAPVACVIKTFTASPSTITAGASSTLSWTTSGCSYAGVSGVANDFGANDNTTVTPPDTTTYTLVAHSSSGSVASVRITITVNPVSSIVYPAGCTSNIGYSSTTGQPCSGTSSNTPVYPAGCTSNVGYSFTTGAPCGGTSSTSNVSLTVTKDANDFSDHVVAAQTNSTTAGITLGQFDLTAQGSAVSLKSLPVHLSVFNSAGIATDVTPLFNTIRLYNANGIQLDSEPVTSNLDVVFHNLPNTVITAGSTQVFTIKGDINAFNSPILSSGISAQVGVSSPGATGIEAYDSSNRLVALTGAYTGSKVVFYVNGIQVTSNASMGTAVATTSPSGATVLGFTIPFSVTAFGTNAYIPSAAVAASSPSAVHAIQFCIDSGVSVCQTGGTGVISYAGTDNLIVDTNGNYLIPVGQTKNFVLQVTYTPSVASSYRARLINVNWNANDSASIFNTFTAGLNTNAFQTNYVVGSGNGSSTNSTGSTVLPAGCTSPSGYSGTTGAPCNGHPSLSQAQMIAQLIAFPTGSNIHTDLGCNGTRYSTTTGKICDGTENDVYSAFTYDTTPRIMEWYSKVNQHIDTNGIWQTDPDGSSGAEIDALTYCKKWYPNTVSVKPYKAETISTWHEAGNVNNWRYTTTSQQCVQ